MNDRISRRDFVTRSGKTALAVGFGVAAAKKGLANGTRKVSPNGKILIGLIGCGGQGRHVMHELWAYDDVEVIAVCDVDRNRMDDTAREVEIKYGRTPYASKDFRDILGIKEIDAVIVGTPDHWHALPTIYACEAGKDVYLEKPISHDIVEGQAIVRAARRYQRVIQVGTWQRSMQHFVDALRFVHSGALGQISVCRAWTLGGGGVGQAKVEDPPPELDWDFWVGPAEWEPYRSNRCHYSFRWFFNYAAGLTGDWGVHMMDIVLLGMNVWDPIEVASVGGKIIAGEDDDRTTPDTQMAIFKFPGFVMNWEIHVGGPGLDGGGGHGCEFIGRNGSLILDRGGYKLRPERGRLESEEIPQGDPVPTDHARNFLDCIKTREKPRSDIESMHKTTTLCHLSNLAYLAGRSFRWDGEKEVVIGDREVMEVQSYQREYRRPWSLPIHHA
jgi:predicted dehydrogenase